jgi:hypothetical protein
LFVLFGITDYIFTKVRFLAPKYQQALVEMETPQAASAVVIHSKTTPVFIAGKEVYFEYSKSQTINTNATSKSYLALCILPLIII